MHHLPWILLLLLTLTPTAAALEPRDVFLLVNKNVKASQEIADYYCARRGVPKDNVLVLDLPAGEDISRADYQEKLVKPLRAALKDRRAQAKVLLSIYGVPLRVGRQQPTKDEQTELTKVQQDMAPLRKESDALQKVIAGLEGKVKEDPKAKDAPAALKERRQERDALQAKLKPLENRQRVLTYAESEACVDSELMLLWWDSYELRRWVVNPLYFRVSEEYRKRQPQVLMTARLDGPDVALIKRLIDTTLEVEKRGLTGKVYVDARGIGYNAKQDLLGSGYGGYDESLREMAKLLKEAKLDVTLDDKPGLFAPDSCPDCALYCGWYSLANYVACCKFAPGAVAYHIASSEAVTLRNPQTKQWCKNLLDNGVVATLGPVAEPYTVGFPKPAEFFGYLVTGEYTLVECYSRTMLLTSWMTVLVGDPLYNPYRQSPRLRPEQVQPSPRGSKFILN